MISSYLVLPTEIVYELNVVYRSSCPFDGFSMFIFGKEYPANLGQLISPRTNPVKYDSLCTAHNDLTPGTYQVAQPVLFRRTTSINVVSSGDYDASHPAGTPLNDLVRIMYFCLDDYLLGKPKERDYSSIYQFSSLSEFNNLKPKLLEFNFYFNLSQPPTRTGPHCFTITYTNEDGVVLSVTTEPITIQGGGY